MEGGEGSRSEQKKLGSDAVLPKASADTWRVERLSSQGKFPGKRTAESCWAASFPATGNDVLQS